MNTTLYRLYAADGTLLYVGISDSWPSRMRQHAREKPWWSDVADVRVEQHPTRPAAELAERAAIQTERPRHNVTHNRQSDAGASGTPEDDPADKLIGHYLHTWADNPRRIQRQGHVAARVGDANYLVEWFDWLTGSPNGRELVALHEMAGWTFYPTHAEWIRIGNITVDSWSTA